MPATEDALTFSTASEQAISASTALEQVIPADDTENLADGGPADMGRADVHLRATEEEITYK